MIYFEQQRHHHSSLLLVTPLSPISITALFFAQESAGYGRDNWDIDIFTWAW
jgi:hypothetical protein